MTEPPDLTRRDRAVCLANNNDWRRQARHVRAHAAAPGLHPDVRGRLLRSADACERQADDWLRAAIERD